MSSPCAAAAAASPSNKQKRHASPAEESNQNKQLGW
jgi:hypothetical protein